MASGAATPRKASRRSCRIRRPQKSILGYPPALIPNEALAKIRAFLDANGFADVETQKLGGYPASQTSVEAPAVRDAISVFKKYADDVTVKPRIAGSAPFYQFTERLGLPLVPTGMGFGTGGACAQ